MFISEIACNSGSEMQRSNVIPSFAWDSVENLIPRRFFRGDLFAIMSVEEKLSRSFSQNV